MRQCSRMIKIPPSTEPASSGPASSTTTPSSPRPCWTGCRTTPRPNASRARAAAPGIRSNSEPTARATPDTARLFAPRSPRISASTCCCPASSTATTWASRPHRGRHFGVVGIERFAQQNCGVCLGRQPFEQDRKGHREIYRPRVPPSAWVRRVRRVRRSASARATTYRHSVHAAPWPRAAGRYHGAW